MILKGKEFKKQEIERIDKKLSEERLEDKELFIIQVPKDVMYQNINRWKLDYQMEWKQEQKEIK